MARPNILMFGDWHWMSQRTDAQEERLGEWMGQQVGKHLVVIEYGAGTAIPTVRWKCEQAGGKLIRINLREAQVPNGHIGLSMGAQEALSGIDDALEPIRPTSQTSEQPEERNANGRIVGYKFEGANP